MKPALVIMAAGLGSRFGGVKQIAQVGPRGEAILDFSIIDGRAAGFGDVVVIIRSEIEDDVRHHLDQLHPGLPVRFVRQDDLGPARAKPWGTLHAVLSAAGAIDGPFAVINADDYYGPGSFRLAVGAMAELDPGRALNVAFELGRTVPPSGAVTRAVTEVADGYLTAIVETDGCERLADGSYVAGGRPVPGSTPVSMNFWCFHQSALDQFAQRWEEFRHHHGDDPKAECQLPTVVGELMEAGRMKVRVMASAEQWIGITNPEDFELVKGALLAR